MSKPGLRQALPRIIPCNLQPSHLVPLPAALVAELLQRISNAAGSALLDALESERSSMDAFALQGRRKSEDCVRLHESVMSWMRRAAVHHGTMRIDGYAPHDIAAMGEAGDQAAIDAVIRMKAIRNEMAKACMELEATLKERKITDEGKSSSDRPL